VTIDVMREHELVPRGASGQGGLEPAVLRIAHRDQPIVGGLIDAGRAGVDRYRGVPVRIEGDEQRVAPLEGVVVAEPADTGDLARIPGIEPVGLGQWIEADARSTGHHRRLGVRRVVGGGEQVAGGLFVVAVDQEQRGLGTDHAQGVALTAVHGVDVGLGEPVRLEQALDAEVVAERDVEVEFGLGGARHGLAIERGVVHLPGALGMGVALHAEAKPGANGALGVEPAERRLSLAARGVAQLDAVRMLGVGCEVRQLDHHRRVSGGDARGTQLG
jgi:hypothetical protein